MINSPDFHNDFILKKLYCSQITFNCCRESKRATTRYTHGMLNFFRAKMLFRANEITLQSCDTMAGKLIKLCFDVVWVFSTRFDVYEFSALRMPRTLVAEALKDLIFDCPAGENSTFHARPEL